MCRKTAKAVNRHLPDGRRRKDDDLEREVDGWFDDLDNTNWEVVATVWPGKELLKEIREQLQQNRGIDVRPGKLESTLNAAHLPEELKGIWTALAGRTDGKTVFSYPASETEATATKGKAFEERERLKTMLKRLIEVALPLKEVSEQSAREKSIRHGHISTLHIWWARRPLAACRAVVFASLIPDPDDPECPESFRKLVSELLETRASSRPRTATARRSRTRLGTAAWSSSSIWSGGRTRTTRSTSNRPGS